MKKVLLLITFVTCTAFYTFAQTQKGDMVFNTMLNFRAGYGYGSLYLQGGINPGVHYLLTNKLAIGASIGLSGGGVLRNGSFSNYYNWSLSIGPYARYYVGSKKIQPFIELAAGYNKFHVNYNSLSGNQDYSHSGSGFYLSPAVGFSYPMTDRISIEGKMSINVINTASNSGQINLSPKIGIGIKLGK